MAEDIVTRDRLPWPNFNAFRDFVSTELVHRKTQYPTQPSAPFVRLTACTKEPNKNYAYFTLGLHGYTNADLNIFDQTYGNGREIVGYAYDTSTGDTNAQKILISTDQLSATGLPSGIDSTLSGSVKAQIQTEQQFFQQVANGKVGDSLPGGAHPIPGILEVNVTRRNIGSPVVATVKWQCYNRAQLEYLRHHFMVVGTHVVLEWGQNFADWQCEDMLDFSNIPTVTDQLVAAIKQGRSYIIDQFVEPNNGNYDFVVATIGNFKLDMDAANGTYQVTTTLYSVGEELWGISMPKTYVNQSDQSHPTTMLEFFTPGSRFDQMIGETSDTSLVANYHENWGQKDENNTGKTTADYRQFRTNPNDYQFISWKYFTQNVIPEMFKCIQQENIKLSIQSFLNFYQPVLADDPDTNSDAHKAYEAQQWIGNNQFLRSISPDVMLIYKSTSSSIYTPADAFKGAGDFDQGGNSDRGLLAQGVWLNTGMLREAFSQANLFNTGIQLVLNQLNAATANFWALQLYYDDLTATYKIVDNNYLTPNYPSFYKFNVGGKGEVLKIQFDSAFPPELQTQMALYSFLRAKSPADQAAFLNEYPSIGTTSKFIFSLNWTALQDIVEQRMQVPVQTAPTGGGNVILNSFVNVAPKITERVASNTTFAQTNTKTTDTTPAVTQLGGIDATGGNTPESAVNPTRNSVDPITPTSQSPVQLLTQLTIQQVMDRLKQHKITRVGKFQFDLSTLRTAVASTKGAVKLTDLFTEDTQNKLFEPYLATQRPTAYTYIKNGSGVTLDQAMIALAKEWASVPVPIAMKGANTFLNAGQSYYAGDSVNKAQYSVSKAVGILQTRDMTQIREMIASGEGTADSVRGPIPGKGFGALKTGSPMYVSALNDVKTYANAPTTPPVQPIIPSGGAVTPPDATAVTPTPTAPADNTQVTAWQQNIRERFGDAILNMVETSPSNMVAKISSDGYANHPAKSNGFVAPIPTSTEITLTLQGIAGLSISDGFYVDKLPFIFEQYGCFQITQLVESITERGWVTGVHGIFRLLSLTADGLKNQTIY